MMGELNDFLRLQIKQFQHVTFLSLAKYCRELLKKFDMEDCKEIATQMATGCYLDTDEKVISVEQTKYRALIGSLFYLTTRRPNIMFSICLCARYQAKS